MAHTFQEILKELIDETAIILSVESSSVDPEKPLALLGFQSLTFVELLVSIERKYGLKLIDMGLKPEELKTLSSLAKRVCQEVESR